MKDIKKAGKMKMYESVPPYTEPDLENEEAEPEIETIRTDADTVKELIEMKFFPKKRKIRLRYKGKGSKRVGQEYILLK